MVKIRVLSYDESIDVFKLGAFGFTPEDEIEDPDYSHSPPDFDDFEVPGAVLPYLIAEYGEPSEFVGKVYELKMPLPDRPGC